MRFEWDEEKNRRNKLKHGISFGDAAAVFFDVFSYTVEDSVVDDEERLLTVGMLVDLTITIVVHVTKDEYGEEIIRIISARKASPLHRSRYQANARAR
jgi:uncharacterized protein